MEQVEGSATSERGGLTSEEKIASLFQPDTLLSDQYFENLRRKTFFEPEKRLMLAVLEDAIRYYQDNWFSRNSKRKRIFDETEEWIVTPDSDWVFSFVHVCETLGLSPAYLRRGLLRWKQRKQNQHHQIAVAQQTKLAG
ncbi:MAG TPA: hypothetical protein VFQ03_00890 [Candidatus Binatia bacterium]|jgi:hypothetical protein|nr:hypothetical protein [Candidatus Binatia bacterium]